MTKKSQVTVAGYGLRPKRLTSHSKLIILVVSLFLAVGVIYWAVSMNVNKAEKVANVADQATLEKSLQASIVSSRDPKGVTYTATRLIAGQKSGAFTISKSDLAQLYLERALAYLQLGQYKNAVDSYEAASQLNNDLRKVALQGEVRANYMLGKRSELIPLYQELINIIQHQDQNQFSASDLASYQANIKALQNNQELQF